MKFLARWRHRVPARNSKRRAAPLGFLTKRYFEKRDPTWGLKILAYEIKKVQIFCLTILKDLFLLDKFLILKFNHMYGVKIKCFLMLKK